MGASAEQKIITAERRQIALDMRKGGATYEEISKKIGVNAECTRRIVVKALDKLERLNREAAEDVRRLDTERIDAAILALQPRIAKGDPKAVQALIIATKRRADMWGTDLDHVIAKERLELDKQARADAHAKNSLEVKRLEIEVSSGLDTSSGVSKIEKIQLAPHEPGVET